ncbi:MAG: 3'3'-cGAMP-specific phosphodiesterase 3 [Syntrophomonadaceae bacterium]|nr:3'3'-cGAMP-specific phosphodiesterase 3 [Bacillota bacterium]
MNPIPTGLGAYEINHCMRVARLCKLWMDSMPWLQLDWCRLIAAAQVHDFGKRRIIPAILNKKDRLTETDWAEIQRHPEWSKDWINSQAGDSMIALIAYQHHESPNGKGYPTKTKDILPEAAVLKICDVYDALTCDREYRKGYSQETTLIIMQEEARNEKLSGVFMGLFLKVIAPPQLPLPLGTIS